MTMAFNTQIKLFVTTYKWKHTTGVIYPEVAVWLRLTVL